MGGHDPPPPPPATGAVPSRQPASLRGPVYQHNQQTPQADPLSRSPILPRPARDMRSRISPPRPVGRDAAREATASAALAATPPKSRTRPPPAATAASLFPAVSLKPQDDSRPMAGLRQKADAPDRADITPDGGSAGREGRQFAVANVGSSGRIYLRPTVRPAHQRYPQPAFVFPMTPPSTAGLEVLATDPGQPDAQRVRILDSSRRTPSQEASTPSTPMPSFLPDLSRPRHRRAMSDSTVPDTSVARDSDPGVFKIVITQPVEEPRPKTSDGKDSKRTLLLDVSIPSWRLGTPRFSTKGTPFLRGSSYAPTEEMRSSNASFFVRTPTDARKQSPSPISIPPAGMARLGVGSPGIVSPRFPPPLRSTYISAHLVIGPAMYDSLTFKPACDDRVLVRYSAATGAVTAATPPRLVAEITSPTFLDYELISDFFLTFRAFLEPADLLRMLIARLRWALARDDEAGMVVRVRTFVAIRHWILNYFMDDFVVDYTLRATFCNLLNDFVDELVLDTKSCKVQLKILAELKKCWRRVCAQYWDGDEFDASLGPSVPVAPGGIAGHRDGSLDPSFWERANAGPPQLDALLVPQNRDASSFYADVSKAGHCDSTTVDDRPATPHRAVHVAGRRTQMSPRSVTSIDVVSCSFPSKNTRFAQPGTNYPLAAHPVDPSSVYAHHDPIATTPRALVGKRVRPHNAHKRNGSWTDSLRDHGAAATERVMFKNTEFLLTLPYAGSLVRGNLLPPGQAFVEILPPSAQGRSSRQTTIFQPYPMDPPKAKEASAMSGQGMRKLLGSVRRALSTKGQGISPTQGNFINISPIGPRGATTNRLPGTAIVPQAARPRPNGQRPPVRIDILGAEVAEDFKRAVREDAAAEAEKRGYTMPAQGSKVPGELLDYSVANMNSSFLLPDDAEFERHHSTAGLTTGSKSIVIVDDTVPLPGSVTLPVMTNAMPAQAPGSDGLNDSFVPAGADPTPPNTPPGNPLDTPRGSSFAFSQSVVRPSASADDLPPFVVDMHALPDPGPGSSVGLSDDIGRPSGDFALQSPNRPPLSGLRGHGRHLSRSSYRSRGSFGRRRYASMHSSIPPLSTTKSFDATTYSEASLDSVADIVPPPLRVLRRRPGGDLRAAENVTDLDRHLIRRSRSLGSLTTFTDSLHSSFIRSPRQDSSSAFVDVMSSDFSQDRADTFSLGAIAEQNPKRRASLFSTHSSKPIMRPSFEAEAQKLAQIPDDLDDDGGVESALLKLEGKYEKKALRLSMEPLGTPRDPGGKLPEVDDEPPAAKEGKKGHRHIHVADEVVYGHRHAANDEAAEEQASTFLDQPLELERGDDARSLLSEDSRESYSSIPLLDRGVTDEQGWADRSVFQDDDGPTPVLERSPKNSPHPSYDFIQKTDSLEMVRVNEAMPRASTEQSFLDIDSDNESELSSELSLEVIEGAAAAAFDGVDTFLPTNPGAATTQVSNNVLHGSSWSTEQSSSQTSHPPSPPMTLVHALQPSPRVLKRPADHDAPQGSARKMSPPTPQATPTVAHHAAPLSSSHDKAANLEPMPKGVIPQDPETQVRNKFSAHLPFILAFDSDILAQQFTLIEKDALNEIDWKELIEMRWKNAENSDARSWVDFLRNADARGVEVVIARFNIMVKWAVSEIVLTQDIEERARCIIKYIHIAAHCRRYRNFATMSQITMALSCNEVSRLTKTWVMVPPSDLKTLHDLETLVSPTRNFYNLRSEMEGGNISSAEIGCIPFVGIYTHDLLFNAQRPSEIASSPTTAPLVNFERCRISASVVKTLLRLLEASTLYTFQPIEGITERCLWMGALSDEEIRKHSSLLEPPISSS